MKPPKLQKVATSWLLLLALPAVYIFSQRHAGTQPEAAGTSKFGGPRSLDLGAALQHRQCPAVPQNGSALSIAFLHIPKTAGTLLVESIRAMVPHTGPGRWCERGAGKDLPRVYTQCGRERLGWSDPEPGHLALLEAVRRNFSSECGVFATHHDFRFFEEAGIDFARSLTMVALRHPVERHISDYYFTLRLRKEMMEANGWAPAHEGDFEGMLAYVGTVATDHQVRQLSGTFGCRWPGGPTTQPEGRAMLEVAKRNLERFCVLIIAELMHESRARLAAAAGWDVEALLRATTQLEQASGKVNANPHPPVPLEIRKAIARHNALDLELYDYAVQLFLQHKPLS